MKDIKILSFEYSDHWRKKLPSPRGLEDKSIYEYPEVARCLAPYLGDGERIASFTSAGGRDFVLEKD